MYVYVCLQVNVLEYGCGFRRVDEAIQHMLKKLISDDCAFQINWVGPGTNKGRFAEMNVKKLIYGIMISI